MKRLTVFHTILLISFGSLAIAGVLVFALAVGNDDKNTVGPINIWGTLDGGALSVILQGIAEVNPIFKAVTYEEKDEATFEAELTTALANGLGPDLFLLRQDYIFRDAGKVVPIPPDTLSVSQFQDTFIDAANPYYSTNGALGIPLLVDPLVLYWNRDLLSSAGLVKPPAYWSDLTGLPLTQKNDSGAIVKSMIAFGEARNIPNAKDILSALILQAGGTITAVDVSGNLVAALSSTMESGLSAADNALRFYTKFADPSDEEYTWSRSLPDARTAFAAGDLALYVGFASEEPLIAQMNPNLNFAIAPLPQVKDSERKVNVGRVYALAITRTGQNPNGALTIASNLAAFDNAKLISEKLGIPSALRDVLAASAEGNMGLFNKQAILARSWRDPDPEKTEIIFRDMIERVTSGAAPAPDALQRAHQELEHILEL